jgi:hypothetical protein
MIRIYLLGEEKTLLDRDLMFVQVGDIHQIDLINIPRIVPHNQNHRDRVEAKRIKEKIKNMLSMYLLVEEKISLDHDLMFVQVDDIHQIDLFRTMHVVLQNRDYIYQDEARINWIITSDEIFIRNLLV